MYILQTVLQLSLVSIHHLINSVAFSRSVVSDSLWPHGLQHAKIPCPALSSRLCSNSCPLSQWYDPTVLCSVAHFSSCLQYLPASESLPMSWPLASDPKVLRFSFSISTSKEYSGWFPLELTGLMCSYIFFFKKTAYTVVPGKLPVWVC